MNTFVVIFELTVFIQCINSSMKIIPSQDYFIPLRTIEINCTASVPVKDHTIEISIKTQDNALATISYIESTGQCLTAPPGSTIIHAIACQTECSCSQNGKSFFFSYNVTSENQTLTFVCSAVDNKTNVNLDASTVIKKAKPPASASTNTTSTVSVSEGDRVGPITCTADCIPNCTYKWTRLGFIEDGPVLQIDDVDRKDNGTYTCEATNKFGSNETSLDILVQYGPNKITLNPTNQMYTIGEDSALGPISCTAECHPSCTLTWTGPGITSKLYVLNVSNLKRNATGQFICTAFNNVGSLNVSVDVTVQYGPRKVSFNTTSPVTVLEGDSVGPIECVADCLPDCTYRWAGYNFTKYGPVLQIDNVQKNNIGIYNCTALNIYKETTGSIEVVVKYGPSVVILKPSNQTYTIQENTSLGLIYCTAQCYPRCNFIWTGPGIKSKSNVLDIPHIKRTNTGQFLCTAYNEIKTINTTVNITVQYAAKIIVMNISDSTESYVHENSSLHFICEAIGVPTPTIRWFHTNTEGHTEMISATNTFLIESAFCTDTGNYTCEAQNEGFIPYTVSKAVNIACVPRLLKKCSSSYEQILTVKRNETLTVVACFLSNPKPSPNWIRHDGNNSVNIVDPAKIQMYINSTLLYTANLNVVLSEEKEVNVAVNANNSFGVSSSTSFRIRIKDKPFSPKDVQVRCEEENVIQWSSSFNGGSEQLFRIQYTEFNQTDFQTTENISDKGQATRHHKLLSLKTNTLYSFIVIATNNINSTISEPVSCTTRESILNSTNSLASIGGTAAAVFVLIGLIVFGILFYRRRLQPRTKNHSKEKYLFPKKQASQADEDAYGLKENQLYGDNNIGYSAESHKNQCNQEYSYASGIQNVGNDDIHVNRMPTKTVLTTVTKATCHPKKNKDGLIYAELDLMPCGSRFIIRGIENRNNYAIIDHTQTAEPLPSNDEEDASDVDK